MTVCLKQEISYLFLHLTFVNSYALKQTCVSQMYALVVLLLFYFCLRRIQKEEHGSQTVPTPLQGSPFRSLNLPEPVLINEDFVKLLHNATYEKGRYFVWLTLPYPILYAQGSLTPSPSPHLRCFTFMRSYLAIQQVKVSSSDGAGPRMVFPIYKCFCGAKV